MRRHYAGAYDGIRCLNAITRLVILQLLALALCISFVPAAWAHAVVLETSPQDRERLDAPPREAWLRFNEPVNPVAVRVLDAGGVVVTAPETVRAEDEILRIALPDDLQEGSYILSYRVTSADGHPVAGSIVFGVGTTAGAAAADPMVSNVAAIVAVAVRALHYVTLLVTAGGGLFIILVLGQRNPLGGRLTPALCLGAAVAALTAVVGIGLAGANLQGASLGSLLEAAPWQTGLATSIGFAGLVALASLLASMMGLALKGRSGSVALVLGTLLASVSLAVTGHAATAPPRWLSQPLVFVHGLMAIYWVGALWPLIVVLRTAPAAETIRVVQQFSRLAIASVIVLVIAGTVLSILQFGSLDAVATTAYGWVWLAKMMLVLVLLALAVINRQRLTPALSEGSPAAGRRLARSIRAELVMVAGITLATASFALTPPPRALLVQEDAREDHHHGHDSEATGGHEQVAGYAAVVTVGERAAVIQIDPAQPGRNQVKAYLTGPSNDVLAPLEATIELAHPDAGIEPISRSLSVSAQGTITGDVDLLLAGRWTLVLNVLVTDFERVVFRTELIVQERSSQAPFLSNCPNCR
jgi:copper transport protein